MQHWLGVGPSGVDVHAAVDRPLAMLALDR